MYSGSTLTQYSGNILGAHQKIDRVARRHLESLMPQARFPSTQQILQFEGTNGPDGIKRKSPARDEPWHFFEPFNLEDENLPGLIQGHYDNLVLALTKDDMVRAAFEAAWLAHAMVDGLTPAHHYPYEEKLMELGGPSNQERSSLMRKLVLPGETRRAQLANNWRMWGPKGLMTTHGGFEWGVATVILPSRLKIALPTQEDINDFNKQSLTEWYRDIAQQVASLHMYDQFYRRGWTTKLARLTRKELAPRLVHSVTLAWYGALAEAHHQKGGN